MKKDISGKRFGMLEAIRDTGKRTQQGSVIWECKCDCGKVAEISSRYLLSGQYKSCGCNHFNACKTHGMSNTRIYHIWRTMKERVLVKTAQKYKDYGGRGIKICAEWLKFENFYNWSIDNGYAENLSIDRIDNDGNYEPSNCRWVTNLEQANNRRTCRYLVFNGEKHSVSEWSRITRIPKNTLWKRLAKGWSVERVLTAPILGSTGR